MQNDAASQSLGILSDQTEERVTLDQICAQDTQPFESVTLSFGLGPVAPTTHPLVSHVYSFLSKKTSCSEDESQNNQLNSKRSHQMTAW